MKQTTKIKIGRYLYPVDLIYEGKRIYVAFRYNKAIIAEVKSMTGAKWHGFDEKPRKIWSISDCPRNHFQLAYLQGLNPYAHYDIVIENHEYQRLLFSHQQVAADFMLSRRQCILAGEPGVGKTLAAIEVMERSGILDWWYVAPKSALRAVEREFRIWKSAVQPQMFTYEAITKKIKEWQEYGGIFPTPYGVIFDESARIKNPTAQRSQAAMILANLIREKHGNDGFVIEMSGAPAPKNPCDWWHQCEIACPGFIKEGDKNKFQKRLAIITQQELFATGQKYPKLESWLDDEDKCAICGKMEDDSVHNREQCLLEDIEYHSYKKSRNEVAHLYDRMQGLVLVQLKKDCLDLPDKHHHVIRLEPNQKIINLAKTIIETSRTTIGAITSLRELSDGFQYSKEECGTIICSVCNGNRSILDPLDPLQVSKIPCDGCGGSGRKKQYTRVTKQIETPKEGALRDYLDEYFEVGRVVIYGGFAGSVDRCVQICHDNGWQTIRVDGRGWKMSEGLCLEDDPLDIFQDKLIQYSHVAFVGQAGAGGIGLTLTASPVIIYYSNDFDADHRIQSEERIHRPGMDLNLGATIIDLIHLQTDELVLNNLIKKRELQALSMGELAKALET